MLSRPRAQLSWLQPVFFGLVLLGSLGISPTHAQTIVDEDGRAKSLRGGTVDCDGGDPAYASVENAVADASEEVLICPGTYGPDENISIDKNLEIKKAETGPVTIQADADSNAAEAISIEEAGSEITSVEIKGGSEGIVIEHTSGGTNTNASTVEMGGGVEGVALKDLVIIRKGDLTNTGSAIKPDGTNIEIEDVDITGGPIGFFGDPSGNYTITNTTIRGAGDEGIWVVGANNLTIRRDTVETTSDGEARDDRLGIAVYDVETRFTFEKNDINAATAPLLLGDELPMSVNGTNFTLTSADNVRTVLGGNAINGAIPGKAAFISKKDGTLRGESDSKGNNGAVHVVRTGVTNVAENGGSPAYNQSALEAAQSGDVLQLTDGCDYAEAVTLTSSPQDSSEADIDVGFAAPTASTLDSLHLEGAYTVEVVSGTLTIGDTLTIGTGSALTGNPVTLGSNATLDDNGLASGTIKATRTVGDGQTVDFGGIGLTIKENSGPNKPGETTVMRTDGEPVTKGDGSIDRYYDVTAANESNLDVDLTLEYDDGTNGDDELDENSLSENDLAIYRSDDVGSTWSQLAVASTNERGNTVSSENLSSVSGFTAAESGAKLPVEFVQFEAVAQDGAAVLKWATASETNNSGFRVQRKTDQGFKTLQFVEGKGTTSQSTSYRVELSDLEYGKHTFRLQQVDRDGSTSLSEPVSVKLGMDGRFEVSNVAPNPVAHQSKLDIAVKETQKVQVSLYDALGRRVQSLHSGRLAGETTHHISLNTDGLSNGSYFVRIRGEGFETTRRVMVVR